MPYDKALNDLFFKKPGLVRLKYSFDYGYESFLLFLPLKNGVIDLDHKTQISMSTIKL